MKKRILFGIAVVSLMLISVFVTNYALKSSKTVKAETVLCALSGECTIDGEDYPYEGVDIEIKEIKKMETR